MQIESERPNLTVIIGNHRQDRLPGNILEVPAARGHRQLLELDDLEDGSLPENRSDVELMNSLREFRVISRMDWDAWDVYARNMPIDGADEEDVDLDIDII